MLRKLNRGTFVLRTFFYQVVCRFKQVNKLAAYVNNTLNIYYKN